MRPALLLLLATAASAQPTGYLEADRPYARIYAPTDDDLEAAIEEVSFAALQFEAAFGEAPPPITVVVTDDPSAVSDLDLPDDGRRVLPFWSRGASAGAPNAILVEGAMLRGDDGAVRVLGVVAGTESPFQVGDQIVALGGEPVASLEDWQAAYGAVGTGQSAAVTVVRGDGRVDLEVDGGAPPPRRAMAQVSSQRPLSHEAGHFFLVSYAAERGSAFERDPDRTYSGVPALPDWLDEGFATFCEPPGMVRLRDAALRRQLGHVAPLDSLLSMVHPLIASGVLDQGTGTATESGPVRVTVSAEMAGALRGAGTFYAQASSLFRFLAARHGPRVIGRIVDRVLDGEPMTDALDGEGIDRDALEAEWRVWVGVTT